MKLNDHQRAVLTLWYVVNASLNSYARLMEQFGDPKVALSAKRGDWQTLGIHKNHLNRLDDDASIRAFLRACEQDLADNRYLLIFFDDDDYPKALKQLYDPPPVLWCRGNIKLLNAPQLAIVGARKPSDYAKKISFDVAQYLVQAGFVITSGLAEGVDFMAHKGALTQTDPQFFGKTVGVMGTGIDVCYPKSHRPLFDEIVDAGGCLISEFITGTPASQHTFPRRNRLVAGLSLATIVTEAGVQSGSLITARLTAEQGKQVFALPNRIDDPNSEGCHHLIREGATLFYHPMQILDEIKNQSDNLPISFTRKKSYDDDFAFKTAYPTKSPKTANPPIAPHLHALYDVLSDEWQDLDALIDLTKIGVADILAQLIELELLGLVNQVGGRYAKNG